MDFNKFSSIILVFSLISYSTFTDAHGCDAHGCVPSPNPTPPNPTPPPSPNPTPPPTTPPSPPPNPTPPPSPNPTPPPTTPPSPPPNPTPPPSPNPTPPKPSPPNPTPPPTTPPSPNPTPPPTAAPPSSHNKCPIDTLKLGVCANLLGLITIGKPLQGSKCCALIDGLADLEAAVCLCIALKANVLGINLNVPLDLSLIISACQKNVPPGFKCAKEF